LHRPSTLPLLDQGQNLAVWLYLKFALVTSLIVACIAKQAALVQGLSKWPISYNVVLIDQSGDSLALAAR
jgi:hypothetical protein